MNKNNLISLIILDVIVMILAIALLAYRYQGIASLPVSAVAQQQKSKTDAPKPQPAASPALQPTAQHEEAAAAEAKKATETRNISFVYKNSKVKKVEVIGDFTQWTPLKMAKGAHYTWKLNVSLAPGDYAYNFVIDGKPRRDPNNPKVCNAGRGFPNSFLKVKSLANENQAE